MAALAKAPSPRNSKIKGKQDSPGAKEGIKSLALLPDGEFSSIPIISSNKGDMANNNKFRPSANAGKRMRLLSMFIFKSAINIVAGKTMERIKLFNPLVSSPADIFFLNNSPITTKRRNEIGLSKTFSIY